MTDAAVTVYLAARWEQAPLMRDWRAYLARLGIGCTSRWLDVAASGLRAIESPQISQDNAIVDLDDVRSADALVFYSPKEGHGSGRGGRHVELGVALALGKRIYLMGAPENVFHWHPLVTVIPEPCGPREVAEALKPATAPQGAC